MKLDEGDGIVDVQICTEGDDVLLTSAAGQCIRFAVNDVRVFQGRTSMGVRGINLADGDRLISLSILRHVEASADERVAYLKRASAVRRGGANGDGEENGIDHEEAEGAIELAEDRYVDLSAAEQFVLTVSEKGFGKRTSSYEYRTTGRGGKGIVAMSVTEKNGPHRGVVPGGGKRPDHAGDQWRSVDPLPGQRHSHRGPLHPGRDRVLDREGERVASVERLSEEGEDNGGE